MLISAENIRGDEKNEQSSSKYEQLMQPFDDEICITLSNYLYDQQNEERLEFSNSPDMLFKLNVHFPAVYYVAQEIYPNDKTIQLAALYHDYGRVAQYRKNGNFNDGDFGSDNDHHSIGYKRFLNDAPSILSATNNFPAQAIDDSCANGVMHKVAMAIKLHGLNGKAFEEDFLNLDDETAAVVEAVSQIDDIANGVQCVGYLLREGQEHSKNVSAGGFIPDENEHLRSVSPQVMELFRESTNFNRNQECKTYPDYYIFGAFLATRALKNPSTREITKKMIDKPITVAQHETVNKEDVVVQRKFESSLDAFKYIFNSQMEPEDAQEATKILMSYYNYGTYNQ